MPVNYASHYSTRATPQSEPIPGEAQVQNNAGGYAYAVDQWARLARFLVLGTDGGTYYVSERTLTRENARVVEACLAEDGARTVREIMAISDAGRAPKNDAAVFALALAASVQNPDAQGLASVAIRRLALDALPKVCRIPTHLFQFLAACKELRRWSRMLRRAVQDWYARWDADTLAYELVKYQARNGWANRDALRLAHGALPYSHQASLRWVVGAAPGARRVERRNRPVGDVNRWSEYVDCGERPALIVAFEQAKTATPKEVARLILAHGLTREMVPTTALNDPDVWAALLERMPATALIRNLGKMSAVGLLVPLGKAERTVADRLGDQAWLRKSRVHPMAILNALRVYASGHGEKGSLAWTPSRCVLDALDAAFYLSFGNVTPTNKRLLLALDVSGSMGSPIAGTGLTCREAAAALALVTANVEPHYAIVGFTNGGVVSGRSQWSGYQAGISELTISPRQRLDDVIAYIAKQPYGGTDCALPWVYAKAQRLEIDAAITVTDNETWAGDIHPSQAVRDYRRTMERPRAAAIVVGMTASNFTIAEPNDPRSLDIVGFDLATPEAMSAFIGTEKEVL